MRRTRSVCRARRLDGSSAERELQISGFVTNKQHAGLVHLLRRRRIHPPLLLAHLPLPWLDLSPPSHHIPPTTIPIPDTHTNIPASPHESNRQPGDLMQRYSYSYEIMPSLASWKLATVDCRSNPFIAVRRLTAYLTARQLMAKKGKAHNRGTPSITGSPSSSYC